MLSRPQEMKVTKMTGALWIGMNGLQYTYSVYSLDTQWNDVPGNYIFARMDGSLWIPLYIGETGSFMSRLMSSPVKSVRVEEEQNLIRRYNPVCNN